MEPRSQFTASCLIARPPQRVSEAKGTNLYDSLRSSVHIKVLWYGIVIEKFLIRQSRIHKKSHTFFGASGLGGTLGKNLCRNKILLNNNVWPFSPSFVIPCNEILSFFLNFPVPFETVFSAMEAVKIDPSLPSSVQPLPHINSGLSVTVVMQEFDLGSTDATPELSVVPSFSSVTFHYLSYAV